MNIININSTNHYRSTRIHTIRLRMQLEKIRHIVQCRNFKKSVLLGTGNILRKVLSIKQ